MANGVLIRFPRLGAALWERYGDRCSQDVILCIAKEMTRKHPYLKFFGVVEGSIEHGLRGHKTYLWNLVIEDMEGLVLPMSGVRSYEPGERIGVGRQETALMLDTARSLQNILDRTA